MFNESVENLAELADLLKQLEEADMYFEFSKASEIAKKVAETATKLAEQYQQLA